MFLSSNFHGLKFRGVVGVLALVGAGRAAMGAAVEVDKLYDGAAGDNFGNAVAIDGDVAIVGTRYGDAAYIYRFNGEHWLKEYQLTGTPGDGFGIAVDISGDVAIIGAWQHNGTGAAYIYVSNGVTWDQKTKLLADGGAEADHFGIAVAIDGDLAIVGADEAYAEYPGPGAAYVFQKPTGGWLAQTTETAKLTALNGAAGDQFGCAVDIDGDVVVVGARFGDSVAVDSGAAYVFSGSNWVDETKLTVSDAAYHDQFGESVSISGDTIVIGAPLHNPGISDAGAAYVFGYGGSGWSPQDKLTLSDPDGGENFGASVAVSGGLLIVGAPLEGAGTGFIYPFRFDGTLWTLVMEPIKALDTFAPDQFGGAVAVSSDERVIVGAAGDDDLGDASGSAYIFEFLDTDGDGLLDYEETVILAAEHPCLDPYESDSDGDNIDDWIEVAFGNPCDGPGPIDSDGDGIGDGREFYLYGTDPGLADTDGDGLDDGDEVDAAMGTGCPDPREWDSDGDGLSDFDDPDPCAAGGPVDTDGDGLTDDDEINLYGTNPNTISSDEDNLSDFVEVDLALANGFSASDIKNGEACPDPWAVDSDGDGLWDDEEVGYDGVPGIGTSPCNPDSDDDGVGDATDPTPLDPGATGDWIEEELRDTRAVIAVFDLDLIEAKNDNAAKGRRNAMSNKVNGAANAVADGDILSAIDKLTSLLAKLDDDPTPPDWMVEGTDEKQALRTEIELMIDLLYYEL